MSNSQNPKPNSCFSTIITRFLLCKGSLPTYPSDQITESNNTSKTKFSKEEGFEKDTNCENDEQVSSSGPGVVARLMGLETLPDMNWAPKSRNADSFPRSKSVNSMDYLVNFSSPLSSQHRRVKTSVSFREPPNQECFIFFLDNIDENNELQSNLRKSEMGFEEISKQRKNERFSKKNKEKSDLKKKNETEKKLLTGKGETEKKLLTGKGETEKELLKGKDEIRRVYRKPRTVLKERNSSTPVGHKVAAAENVEVKSIERKKKKKSCEMVMKTEHDLKKFSSVSVDHAIHLSGDSRSMKSKSRRKSSQTRAKIEYPSSHNNRVSKNEGLKQEAPIKKSYEEAPKIKNEGTDYYTKVLGEIRSLTEEETMKEQPYWVAKTFDDLEEFSLELELQILDQMVHQMVDELSEYL